MELHSRHPFTVLFGVFAVIEWIFLVAGMFLLPGVISVLGFWRVAGANLLAAAGIAAFLWANHQPEAWERFKQTAHFACGTSGSRRAGESPRSREAADPVYAGDTSTGIPFTIALPDSTSTSSPGAIALLQTPACWDATPIRVPGLS